MAEGQGQRPRQRGGVLTQYFLLVLGVFGCFSIYLSSIHTVSNEQLSIVESFLRESWEGRLERDRPPRDELPVQQEDVGEESTLAGLSCDRYGGPADQYAQEMVYWSDIPSDSHYVSPFHKKDSPQYMTFEPDEGGWNNIRMAMETVLALAFAMGRTLVLPPEQSMYLLTKGKAREGHDQRVQFGFNHFFHMEKIHDEHPGLDIITMEVFLEREAMTGRLRDRDGNVAFPPGNRTRWDGESKGKIKELMKWLRSITENPIWDPETCMAVFPKTTDPSDIQVLLEEKQQVEQEGGFPSFESYIGKPNPVDAPSKERMKENWAGRKDLCVYDEKMQAAPLVHFPVDFQTGARLLVHFYALLHFQDWKVDLWMKRFVRDHVRYIDEIQCAAARVVKAVRDHARNRQSDRNPKGEFDSFHIRRGDFQYKVTRFDAPKIYEMSKAKLTENATVYIATDERDKAFFQPLMDHYDVVFLDDFAEVLEGINTNYYGMIDQLVASRGRIFFGCWFSTFTGYINRMRGYHSQRDKSPGYEDGIVPSWYYALEDRYDHMQVFYPVKRSYYAREFPTSWRGIDASVGLLDAN